MLPQIDYNNLQNLYKEDDKRVIDAILACHHICVDKSFITGKVLEVCIEEIGGMDVFLKEFHQMRNVFRKNKIIK